MTNIKKPAFQVTPQKLEKALEGFEKDLQEVKTTGGTVSMNKLANAVDGPVEHSAYNTLVDEFTHDVQHRASGCSGAYTSTETPERLGKGDVDKVFDALLKAKAKTGKIDKNNDGVISLDEAKAVSSRGGLAGKLLKASVGSEVERYEHDLQRWVYSLNSVTVSIKQRVEADDEIRSVTGFHAKSKLGAEALAWAFRDLTTDPDSGLSHVDMDRVLTQGEGSEMPLVVLARGYAARASKGHLDNDEIKALLATDDLQGYVDTTRTKVEARLGGDFFDSYLKGTDLPNSDQLNDPDYKAWASDNRC
ncbi:MAG: hypothetical protein ABIJ09_27340 [Pseudomonadota bacterium]